MRKIKKLVATLLAATMMLAMGVTAFAADATTLSNAKFVKESGADLAMGMGTGVIVANESTIDADGNISVKLQSYSRWAIITYTGSIESAYYVDEEGNVIDPSDNLVTSDGYLKMDSAYAEAITDNMSGIHLQLNFNMKPSTPPGMKNTMNAYFVCDDIK